MTQHLQIPFYRRLAVMLVAVTVAAAALPAQAQHDYQRDGYGRQVYHRDYRGGHDNRRDYRGGGGDYRGDGSGDLGAILVGAILGAVVAGAVQAPPAVIYRQPPPPPPPGVRYYPRPYYPDSYNSYGYPPPGY
ncbi:hypothetical protein [Pseudomonas helvetica]|uniref:hypothetical protein n=1 Tax=Pseudomonas helvetica TaxID=3136738 RepID=UPI0032664F3C